MNEQKNSQFFGTGLTNNRIKQTRPNQTEQVEWEPKIEQKEVSRG